MPRWIRLIFALLALYAVTLTACGDGDIRKGCRNYCKCHRGKGSKSACEARCAKKLKALKKRDRARERQGQREDHTYLPAQSGHVHIGAIEILAVQQNLA